MDTNLELELLILMIFLVASVVAIIGRRFRIPYTVGLVIAGLIIGLRSDLSMEISPRVFLSLFLPPLLFEAAFHLNFERLRQNLGTIVFMAVPGVILNMLFVGFVIHWGDGLVLPIAIVFGSLIAATDPVAVVGIFRKLGAPKRLEVLLEGESLLNDGTAIVMFNLALAAVAAGSFDLAEGVTSFIRVAGGGLIIGLLFGWLFARATSLIDDHLVETTLTTLVAFGSFFVAEDLLHFSGVLAVVAAGIVSGNVGPQGMSPTTKIVVFNFWEYAAFAANSAVFLLIGLQTNLTQLLENWKPILWAIAAVLLSRAFVVYFFSRLISRMETRWRHVLFWGGLRGAISLALALSLPLTLGDSRDLIITMTFGVVLFSIIVQGFSMDRVLARLKVIERNEGQIEYERRQARALAERAGYERIQKLSKNGLISEHTWEHLQPVLEHRVKNLTSAVQEILRATPDLEEQELINARREMLRAQRGTLATLRRDGIISDLTYDSLLAEVDEALDSSVEAWTDYAQQSYLHQEVCQLLMVVIQERDLESATNALRARGVLTTRVRSDGGFLRRTNHLLIVGIPDGELESTIRVLREATRGSVEYLSAPVDNLPGRLGKPKQIELRGATVFVFDVEQCEVI
ncbi:MAG: Na+/H+ antiporter [Anaerolineales bacterium]|jgi:CPA1 family monovalent cation:H+ antiporter